MLLRGNLEEGFALYESRFDAFAPTAIGTRELRDALGNVVRWRGEAGKLIKTIGAQMAILMATVWTVNLAASALKLGSAGLSTIITAAARNNFV